ncbi:MAG: molybdenum cofactor carrier [Magnetococcales bacterium]|nr:putative molybdenum carrier protein [Magnetococcales bacterium]NGZ28093.1 molybdenum cofactor carrier [Magnetococcales bacterium]
MIQKIISGGQTGVDRAALDFAIQHGIDHGGWCPKGRLAEDGILHPRYKLTETPLSRYNQRTHWNILDSHGTLIIRGAILSGGTALTWRLAKTIGRPCFTVTLQTEVDYKAVHQWVTDHSIQVVNMAGPRESDNPGIYRESFLLLTNLFAYKEPATLNHEVQHGISLPLG